jgi:hypothetical protein
MLLNPRYISRGIPDRGAMKSETAPQLAETYSNSSRRHLVCQWRRTAEGLLVCAWHHDSPIRSEDSDLRIPADSLESKMGPRRRSEPENRAKMNRQRTLEVEASPPAALTSTSNGTLVPPARPRGGAQAIIQGFAIALLLALTGLETFVCFSAPGERPFLMSTRRFRRAQEAPIFGCRLIATSAGFQPALTAQLAG